MGESFKKEIESSDFFGIKSGWWVITTCLPALERHDGMFEDTSLYISIRHKQFFTPKHGQRLRSRFGPYSTTERIASVMNKFAYQELFGPRIDRWNPANQLRLVVYPIIDGVLYIPIVAGFLPSTVGEKKLPNSFQPITPLNLCSFLLFLTVLSCWQNFWFPAVGIEVCHSYPIPAPTQDASHIREG